MPFNVIPKKYKKNLLRIDEALSRTGPKMYTREEVAEEGLLWGQVQRLHSVSLPLSEQPDSTVLSFPLCRTS